MERKKMERLKNLRDDIDLKQEDVANIIGLKRSTYTSYEIGRDTIPISHLNTLCNYFDVSIDYVLGLTDQKKYFNMKPDIDKALTGKRLKLLRKENNITQIKMAEILNISRSTWTGYESSKYQIPTLILYELAKRYHTSIDYLLGKISK